MKNRFVGSLALLGLVLPLCAAPLTESKFTEVIQDVKIVASADKSTTSARPNDLLKAPDLVRTGAASRAELTAADDTITRIGANSVFSFSDSGRTLNLERGNVLFHAPHGHGGGTIKSGGAVAAVLGTTLVVSATAEGGFKVILLEGKGRVTLANGRTVTLKGGQMVFVLAGGSKSSSVFDINLGKLVTGSALVSGFSRPLPSLTRIKAVVRAQNSALASGAAVDTGNSPGGLNSLDHGSYQAAMHPTPTGAQFGVLDPQNPQFNPKVNGAGGRGLLAR
jgi:hypothetical protein